jgi:hypothetical protein
MLKIWKQAWKKEDSKRSQNGLGGGSRSDTPHTGSDALPIPDSVPPAPAFDNSRSRNKRTNASVGPASLHEVERSPKKVKLGHSCDNAPRNPGPIPDGLSVLLAHPSIFDKTVLRQARLQNSALFPDTRIQSLINHTSYRSSFARPRSVEFAMIPFSGLHSLQLFRCFHSI